MIGGRRLLRQHVEAHAAQMKLLMFGGLITILAAFIALNG